MQNWLNAGFFPHFPLAKGNTSSRIEVDRGLLLQDYKQKVSFWDWIPEEFIPQIKKHSQTLNFSKGENVFSENDSYKGFFVVESGLFKVYKLSENGKEIILKIFFPHEIIAYLPLMNDAIDTYPANCQAVIQGKLLFIDTINAKLLSHENSRLEKALTKGVTDCTRFVINRFNSQISESAEKRLWNFLEHLGAHKEEITLDMPKNQIALLLSITPETFSRSVANLKKENKLSQNGHKYRLLNA